MASIRGVNANLNETIEGLDHKLHLVLKKKEHDYLKGYSIYVKQKEQELRELINKLNEKNSNNSLKDDLIYKLKQTIMQLHEAQIKTEKEKTGCKEKIKYWTARAEAFEQDKNFLQGQIVEQKRQNQLLKLAVGRLQKELDNKDTLLQKMQAQQKSLLSHKEFHGSTFMTSVKNDASDAVILVESPRADAVLSAEQTASSVPKILQESSTLGKDTVAGSSYLESRIYGSKIANRRNHLARSSDQVAKSRYSVLPTTNMKFEKFIDRIFTSHMAPEDVKDQIVKYV